MSSIINKLSRQGIDLAYDYDDETTEIIMNTGNATLSMYFSYGCIKDLLELKSCGSYFSGGNSFLKMSVNEGSLHIVGSVSGCGGDCEFRIKFDVEYVDEFVDYIINIIQSNPNNYY